MADAEGRAVSALGGAAVVALPSYLTARVSAEQAGHSSDSNYGLTLRGRPQAVVRTMPSCRLAGQVDAIGGRAEADRSGSRAACRRTSQARRCRTGVDHSIWYAFCVARVELDVVAGTVGRFLELHAQPSPILPTWPRVTADFGQTVAQLHCPECCKNRSPMRSRPNLNKPQPDRRGCCRDVGSAHSGIGIRAGTVGADRSGNTQIIDRRAIPY